MTRRQKAKLYVFLRNHGFAYPLRTVAAIDKTGIKVADALTILEKESARGRNLFGHDAVANPIKGGYVTKARYLRYKAYRKAGWGMQGVGPCQLTWYAYQDQADALGGCWRPQINMIVGFRKFKRDADASGTWAAARAYNGASAYANDFVGKRAAWVRALRRAGFKAR